jgi:hypothetical protein
MQFFKYHPIPLESILIIITIYLILIANIIWGLCGIKKEKDITKTDVHSFIIWTQAAGGITIMILLTLVLALGMVPEWAFK